MSENYATLLAESQPSPNSDKPFCPHQCLAKILRKNADVLSSSKNKEASLEDTITTRPEQFEYPNPLSSTELLALCSASRIVLEQETTCVDVEAPVTIIGDIHGQLFDLFELLAVSGKPPDSRLLFLGDYVDRGFFSIETVSLVLLFKLLYPGHVTLLRGNHESRQLTQVYGFYDECIRKYNTTAIWKAFMDTFDCLPLCATVEGHIFTDHGGLSPNIEFIDQVRYAPRCRDLPYDDQLADLLWSDPDDTHGWNDSPRGAGYVFGPDITDAFCRNNGVAWICRAHQVAQDGFSFQHSDKVCTLFSAPNYCYRCSNKAALCEIYEDNARGPPQFVTFESAPKRTTGGFPLINFDYFDAV